MTLPLRQTGVLKHRRFIVEAVVGALRSVFDLDYSRERQFQDLKITTSYPLQKVDYPAIVVDFDDGIIKRAGIGHVEWFQDEQGILRKWEHSRFEGSLRCSLFALSTIDRDLLADAFVELMQFGRLDLQLDKFYVGLYGSDQDPVEFIYNQIMLNDDTMQSLGNSATIAPWQPEDQLVYMTGYTMEIHGGFYNKAPTDEWGYVQHVDLEPYPQGEINVTLPIIPQAGEDPFTNPFVYDEEGTAGATGGVSAAEDFDGGIN